MTNIFREEKTKKIKKLFEEYGEIGPDKIDEFNLKALDILTDGDGKNTYEEMLKIAETYRGEIR